MAAGQTSAMRIWCWIIVAFGAIIIVTALERTLGERLFAVFGHSEPVPWSPHLVFTMSLMGAVTVGWGLTLLAIARQDVDASVWRGVTVALIIWYFVDSALSIGTGFWRNAVSNSVLLLAYLYIRSRAAKHVQG